MRLIFNAKEYEEAYTFVESFFEIIENDSSFRKNVIDAAEQNRKVI